MDIFKEMETNAMGIPPQKKPVEVQKKPIDMVHFGPPPPEPLSEEEIERLGHSEHIDASLFEHHHDDGDID